MAPNRGQGPHKGPNYKPGRPRDLKRKRDIEDVEQLLQKVAELDPKPATPPADFSELPLSQPTRDGLQASHFKKLTTIQARGIPVSLKGKDVLGAAKTGSGKTLAFIVPVLENLYRRRWTEYDGVGALILSPTRELAIQIFDVLRKVGRNHTFSAGLVIGGKSLQEERDRLSRMNILVATPGRILQHLDQTADLDIGNLQMLVLDEADRIMDMGFSHAVDAIVGHLPQERQTLMFSATQTKKVSDLARLSLVEPEFVSVHESAESATPTTLQQNYVVTPIAEKLDTLWSFIRANVKKKILVFFSSGKQVRFAYEAFRHLQPGLTLLHLHGRQKQTARLDITTKFSNAMHACLFSTDVAARGLDFPAVDWVVQVDCPEDADTYIHRVGRTARFEHDGRAVMFLDPSEQEGMIVALEQKRVTGVEEIHVKQKKMQNSIKKQLQNMCFKDPELKYLGQKAFVSYVRSVYVQKDKSIFDVRKLDLEAFASSMGLPGAPRVKFVKGEDAKERKNMPRALVRLENGGEDESTDEEGNKPKAEKEAPAVRTKYDRMFERRNQDVLTDHYARLIDDEEDETRPKINPDTADADSDNDFMSVKRRFNPGDETLGQEDSPSDADDTSASVSDSDASNPPSAPPSTLNPKTINLSSNLSATPLVIDSNRRSKLLKSKKALLKYKGHGSHLVFSSDDSDDNTGKEKIYYEKEDDFKKKGDAALQKEREQFLEEESRRVKDADVLDREVARDKRREKKVKRKERAKAELENDAYSEDGGDGEELGVQLIPFEEDEEDEGEDTNKNDGGKDKKEKRKRKWFEDDEDSEGDDGIEDGKKKIKKKKSKGRRTDLVEEEDTGPRTLEDLEALASGLLAN